MKERFKGSSYIFVLHLLLHTSYIPQSDNLSFNGRISLDVLCCLLMQRIVLLLQNVKDYLSSVLALVIMHQINNYYLQEITFLNSLTLVS